MLLFGHRFIESESFYHVLDIDSVGNTPPSSTVCVEFSEENLDIISHLRVNHISMALSVKTVEELIYASTLDASYIIVQKDLAESAHKIATDYLFDAKILVLTEDEKDIEELAFLGVDGVIFPNAILKITS